MDDNPRVLELRRRVEADPASIAFAQLAEECRRSGEADEAVAISRAGLAHHPGYLSARVTLGRALLETGRLDEAEAELGKVVQAAPTNLPAIRGLAEVFQQRGDMGQALEYYRRALRLARFDPDLEDSVERLSRVVSPEPATPPPVPVKVEELFDFDSLLKHLGAPAPAEPPAGEPSAPEPTAPEPPLAVAPSPIQAVDLSLHQQDAFAEVERDLRERAAQRMALEKASRAQAAAMRDTLIVAELEAWLSQILVARSAPDQA